MAGLPLENPCLEERMDEIRERLDQIGADLKGQKELQTEPGAWLMGFFQFEFWSQWLCPGVLPLNTMDGIIIHDALGQEHRTQSYVRITLPKFHKFTFQFSLWNDLVFSEFGDKPMSIVHWLNHHLIITIFILAG